MRPDDYAILVGIQKYPGAPLVELSGPLNDVEYFRRWLIDPRGGDMNPANVRTLLTPSPAPMVPIGDYPPTHGEFYTLFRSIVYGPGPAPIKRPNGRLYLLFSGHGFSDIKDNSTHAALYCANVQPGLSWNVCGTVLARWCQRAAVFGEVVLVMDCCRDAEVSKKIDVSPLDDIYDPASNGVRKLEVYAVPFGDKAQERDFSDVERRHGLLTYTLVTALYGAPLEAVGKGSAATQARTGHTLKKFMEGCWHDIAGDNGPEAPEFVLPHRGDICFSSHPPGVFPRRVRFLPPIAGTATLSVVGDNGQANLVVELDAGQSQALIKSGAAAPVKKHFDGTDLVLELHPEMYEARLEAPGSATRTALMPMVGDQDVVV